MAPNNMEDVSSETLSSYYEFPPQIPLDDIASGRKQNGPKKNRTVSDHVLQLRHQWDRSVDHIRDEYFKARDQATVAPPPLRDFYPIREKEDQLRNLRAKPSVGNNTYGQLVSRTGARSSIQYGGKSRNSTRTKGSSMRNLSNATRKTPTKKNHASTRFQSENISAMDKMARAVARLEKSLELEELQLRNIVDSQQMLSTVVDTRMKELISALASMGTKLTTRSVWSPLADRFRQGRKQRRRMEGGDQEAAQTDSAESEEEDDSRGSYLTTSTDPMSRSNNDDWSYSTAADETSSALPIDVNPSPSSREVEDSSRD